MIKFLDLKKINGQYKEHFMREFENVLDSGWYISGEKVKSFEKNFADFCGTNHCVSVNSGLDALTISLLSLIHEGKLKRGDEVILPVNTFVATANSVLQAQLVPVFCDIDSRTMNLSVSAIDQVKSAQTKAVIPVHLYGRLCEMDEIVDYCGTHSLLIVEDCAQAHGAMLGNKKAGSFGELGAFSFYPGKNLGALGDGGAIITNDHELAQTAMKVKNYGSTVRYQHELMGMNSRLDEIQAAFLTLKLRSYGDEVRRRREIASYYYTHINNEKVELLAAPEDIESHVYHLFVIKVSSRDAFMQHMRDEGVEVFVHYPTPLNEHEFLSDYRYCSDEARDAISKIVSIPIGSHLEHSDVSNIVEIINSFA